MRIIKINPHLYRIYNEGKCKDAWVSEGVIQPPRTNHDALTPTERTAVEMEIF